MQNVSALEYPGKIAAILYLTGCNFRCPYCHNPSLIEPGPSAAPVDERAAFAYLKRRAKTLDAVVLSGGEPTLHPELPALAARIRTIGLLVKVDTNGTRPNILMQTNADYVALDIKTSFERYDILHRENAAATRDAVMKTLALLKEGTTPYEIRITAVPGIVTEEDIERLLPHLSGVENVFLQRFSPRVTLDKTYASIIPYSKKTLETFRARLLSKAKRVTIR